MYNEERRKSFVLVTKINKIWWSWSYGWCTQHTWGMKNVHHV